MKFLSIFAVALVLLGAGGANATVPTRWTVYYGAEKPWEEFNNYDLIVFDGDHHPEVKPLISHNKEVLAYLSLVEVASNRSFYKRLQKEGLLLGALDDDRAVIDVRNPKWTRFLLEELIPFYVRQGFTGLMFDTVDTAGALEAKDPEKYAGMRKAAVMTIRHIRRNFPYLHLMVNRGFDLLPQVEKDIDMVLAESIMIDSRSRPARLFPVDNYNSVLGTLANAKARNPEIRLFSLDYWDMEDKDGVKKIYDRQREAGFVPYVSTPDLQAVYAEP